MFDGIVAQSWTLRRCVSSHGITVWDHAKHSTQVHYAIQRNITESPGFPYTIMY